MEISAKPASGQQPLKALFFLSLALGIIFLIDFSSIFFPQVSQSNHQALSYKAGEKVDFQFTLDAQNPEYTLQHPEAKFLAVHFTNSDFPEGVTIHLKDSTGILRYTYPGDAAIEDEGGSFWTAVVFDDSVRIELSIENPSVFPQGFQILANEYMFGYPSEQALEDDSGLETIIGVDNLRDVACYETSDPEKYANSSPVALLINYTTLESCTAFRVGPDNYLLTAKHCVDNFPLSNVLVFFNCQNVACDGSVLDTYVTLDDDDLTLHSYGATQDRALLEIEDTTSIDAFGYLPMDNRDPEYYEIIHIPQHPLADEKQFGIESDMNLSLLCLINDEDYSSTDIGFLCDTDTGSSGAPIITEDGRVIAMVTGWNDNPSDPVNIGLKTTAFDSTLKLYIRPETIASLTFPSVGSITYTTTPTYMFPDENMADEIRIWIAHNQDGVIFNDWISRSTYCLDGTCSYQPAVEHPYGEYQVMFQTRNSAGSSEWSSIFEYTLGEMPTSPSTTNPNGNEAYIRPTFSWNTADYANEYRVMVSHAAVGTVINEWIDAASYCGYTVCNWQTYTHLRTGNHTWWVMARNGIGSSAWSIAKNFKIWNTTPPIGSVTKVLPGPDYVYGYSSFSGFYWNENQRASWYKVYMSDFEGKLYNQYHKAADLCYGGYCSLTTSILNPLIHAPRGLSELPIGRWIHWQVMPVNVAGNGDWTGYTKVWINPP